MGLPVSHDESALTPNPGLEVTPLPRADSTPAGASSQIDGSISNTGTLPFTPPNVMPRLAAVPEAFGPYEILEEIAHGGMGVVFKARDRVLGRVVALKTIRSGKHAGDQEVERFFREAKAVANLKHPHIIKIHDFGQLDGRYYFTMTLAEGGSLTQSMARFAQEPKQAVQLLEKVARAVQYVHEQGLLHRDLKPGNILLEDADQPLVSDFGLARALEPSGEDLTRSGETPGTPAYMAPEQASGANRVCPQTDVWALGVILFEVMCGRKPFISLSRAQVTQDILSSDPPDPRSLQPKLDRALEAVILKCLQKDPARRYASAGALADDLGCWLRGEPTKARPLSWLRRFVHRHPRWVAPATGLVVVAGVVALALHYLDPDRPLKDRIVPDLRRGKAVELLADKGLPDWSRWLVPGVVVAVDDAPLSLHSGRTSLLELLPEVPRVRYRFRAEIRHEAGPAGEVGLYFCCSSHEVAWGPVQAYCAVSFADWGQRSKDANGKPKGTVRMRPYHFSEPKPGKTLHHSHETTVKREFVPLWPTQRTGWRQVDVQVTPQDIRVRWEGDLIGVLSAADRLAHAKRMVHRRPSMAGATPEFPIQGGLGLYLENAGASFRNVVVEPLPE